MTPSEARERFLSEMEARGVGRWTTAPPLYRLLWALGLEVPPPHFLGTRTMAIVSGGVFTIVLGAIFLLWMDYPVSRAAGQAVISGVFFGSWMAWRLGKTRKSLRLPSWEEYKRTGMGPVEEKSWEMVPPPRPPTSPPSP